MKKTYIRFAQMLDPKEGEETATDTSTDTQAGTGDAQEERAGSGELID
jgi:hypothetical protein